MQVDFDAWDALYSEKVGATTYGILKGPTYPCEFYAGMLGGSMKKFFPWWNGTCYYHRTQDEALAALAKLIEHKKKEMQQS